MPKIQRSGSKLPWVKERKGRTRKADPSFYNTTKWRKLSKAIRLENPLCEVYEHFGEIRPTNVTDHIIRIESGGAKLDPANLMSMSSYYHDIKSGKEKTTPILIEWVLNDYGEKIPKNKADIFKIFKKFTY